MSLAAAGLQDIVVFGGGTNGSYNTLSSVEIYNVTSRAWTRNSSALSVPRAFLAAASAGDAILFAGGTSASLVFSSAADLYNITTNTWSPIANLSVARDQLAGASAGDLILFGGGLISSTTIKSSAVDIYDVKTGQWLPPSNLSVARGALAAVGVKNYVLFAGGADEALPYSDVVDIYNVDTRQWLNFTVNLSMGRCYLSAASAGDLAFFVGGYNGSYVDVVDIFNVSSMTWLPPTTLSEARGDTAAASTSSRVLVGGGVKSGAFSNIVDIFDVNNSPLSAPPLPQCSPIPSPRPSPTPRPTSGNPPPPAGVTTPPPSTAGVNIPLVAGISGGVAVVVLAVLVVLLVVWKRRRNRQNLRGTHTLNGNNNSYDKYLTLCAPQDQWLHSKSPIISQLNERSPEHALALALFKQLDGSRLIECGSVKSISAIMNGRFNINFTNQLLTLQQRHLKDPHLFSKMGWLEKADRVDLRRWVIHEFGSLAQRYPWNKIDESCPVIPFVHGTSGAVARKIIDNGFSTLSSLDAGFYGSGMYFTSSSLYALPYFSAKPDPAILICLVVPGNPYPVVEAKGEEKSFLGRPLIGGYQSNYVLTTKDGNPCATRMQPGTFYDELVIGQESQVVPIFLVEFEQAKLAPLARSFQREVAH
jgi:hypothetical protein